MFEMILVVIGLAAFEIISSVDNAVVNADVLGTMKDQRAKRFFLTWGIFFAIFVVRGILPFAIFYGTNPSLGIVGSFTAMFNGNQDVKGAIEATAPFLMIGGGMFLFLLFLHWLLMEDKKFGLPHERFVLEFGSVWFYAIASLLLPVVIIVLNHLVEPEKALRMTLSATIGYCVFFITGGFKENAERMERRLVDSTAGNGMSDWAKVVFLEVIDTTFSIDGVIGAFAFTMAVPLILLGNGIGAIVVRQLTIGNVDRIRALPFLKNGAMYSIGILGSIMIAEAFGIHVPSWASPIATFIIIGFFLWKSLRR